MVRIEISKSIHPILARTLTSRFTVYTLILAIASVIMAMTHLPACSRTAFTSIYFKWMAFIFGAIFQKFESNMVQILMKKQVRITIDINRDRSHEFSNSQQQNTQEKKKIANVSLK